MKLYLIGAIFCMVLGAYFAGLRIANIRCSANSADAQVDDMVHMIKINRLSNEKVFNTGVRDIRSILHTKYSIAD